MPLELFGPPLDLLQRDFPLQPRLLGHLVPYQMNLWMGSNVKASFRCFISACYCFRTLILQVLPVCLYVCVCLMCVYVYVCICVWVWVWWAHRVPPAGCTMTTTTIFTCCCAGGNASPYFLLTMSVPCTHTAPHSRCCTVEVCMLTNVFFGDWLVFLVFCTDLTV